MVNEFYKKRCQEKSSASAGRREGFGLEIQPTAVTVPPDSLERFCSGLFAIPVVHLLMVTTPIESETWQASPGVFSVHHGSIGGSRPIAISGETRGHSVKWETRCRRTRGEPDRPPPERVTGDGKACS